MSTPELDKLKLVSGESQSIGEFLDWLQTIKKLRLCSRHEHGAGCRGWDEGRNRYNPRGEERCNYYVGQYLDEGITIEKLLAEYFEIDMNKVETERSDVLDAWREEQGL